VVTVEPPALIVFDLNAKESDQRRHSWRANDEMLRLGTLKQVESSGVDRSCRACRHMQMHSTAYSLQPGGSGETHIPYVDPVRSQNVGHDAVINQRAAGFRQSFVCEVILIQPERVRQGLDQIRSGIVFLTCRFQRDG